MSSENNDNIDLPPLTPETVKWGAVNLGTRALFTINHSGSIVQDRVFLENGKNDSAFPSLRHYLQSHS